ncbi:MAG TPA: TniB family NTP-binding protein [Arenimonas sp.]|uniref:TniB family NTP-binding protein n=1 Tax=Arenimonas sp. TaxID=1872635 RepID=UPI002D7EACFE|nr:TniB family NTP-binding protein [Arenimonas sp.]HEU0153151.1 TniB family NTP-binding protein [Arenimonas sp.]
MADYPHLDELTRPIMGLSEEARLAWFQTEFWIKYDRADAIIRALSDLVLKPRRDRMAGYVVTADTNNGKSRIAKRILDANPMQVMEGEEARFRLPVVLHEMLPGPTESAMLDNILDQLGVPYRSTDPVQEKRRVVILSLQAAETKLLMIDEIQRMLGARREARLVLLDAIRYIASQVPLPIAAFSTPRGTAALASSDELINRLRALPLPPWPLDKDFQSLLASFELRLPLTKPSKLSAPSFASLIHALTEGYIGEVYDLLEFALREALVAKLPCLPIEFVRALPWAAPSDRKRAVKSQGE